MADASALDILIKALEDEKAAKWREIFSAGTDKTFTIRMIGANQIPGGVPGSRSQAITTMPGGVYAGTFNNLNMLYWRESIKHFVDFRKYTKELNLFQATLGTMSTGLAGLSRALIAGGGLLGGAAAAGAAYTAMGRGVQEDRRQAFALGGANVGKMRAAGVAFGSIMNVSQTLGNIATAQTDFTSDQYLGLKLLGFTPAQIQSMDPSDLMAAALEREQVRIRRVPKGRQLPTAEARGATALFGPDIIRTLGAMTPEELRKNEEQYKQESKTLDIAKKTQDAYDELIRHIEAAGLEIETVFVKDLVDVAPIITKFVDSMAKGVEALSGEVKEIIKTSDEIAKQHGYSWDELFKDWWESFKGAIPGFGKEGTPNPDYHPTIKGWQDDPILKGFTDALKDFTDWAKASLPSFPGEGFTGYEPGGLAGPYGTTPGGHYAAPGAGFGPGRRPSGGDAYPGKINMPATGGRAGRGGSAGFGLYASDVGLAASKNMSAEERAFLDTIGTGETPRGSYSNPDFDPGGLGGRYQFLRSTWVTEARKAGVDPGQFTPENQDKVAAFYADEIVRQRTGKSLVALLGSGPEGAQQAITAMHGVWNGIFNVDPDKRGHSGAVKLFMKKLQDERAANKDAVAKTVEKPLDNADKDTVKKLAAPPAGYHFPNIFTGRESSQYPSPTEKSGADIPTSMNDMRLYQMDKGTNIRISNPAGASVNVQTAMLGATRGAFA